MKKCELCKKIARMYCESDRASLCWDCDSRVHTANFLVGKHTRTLLCHSCQSPTPWTGSGPTLGPTVSVCDACVNGRELNTGTDRGPVNRSTEDDDDVDEEDEDDDEYDEEEENEDCIDDDSENQVVPLSLPTSFASTSSSSEESSSSRRDGFMTTVENSRFPYNVVERTEEKDRTQNIKSWTWR